MLASMHRNRALSWTIAALAQEAGVSRSALALRFLHYLNEPLMAYLPRWHLHASALLLILAFPECTVQRPWRIGRALPRGPEDQTPLTFQCFRYITICYVYFS